MIDIKELHKMTASIVSRDLIRFENPDLKEVGGSDLQISIVSAQNSDIVALALEDTIKTFSRSTSKMMQAFKHPHAVKEMVLSKKAELLVSGCVNGDIYVWSVVDGKLLKKLNQPSVVSHLLLNASATVLITAGEDNSIRFWSLETGKILREFTEKRGAIQYLGLSSDARWLLSCEESYIAIRDLKMILAAGDPAKPSIVTTPAATTSLATIATTAAATTAVTPTPVASSTVASSSLTSTPAIGSSEASNSAAKDSVLIPIDRQHKVISMAISPDGRFFVTASQNRKLTLWSSVTKQKIKELSGVKNMVTQILMASDGKWFLTVEATGGLKLWSEEGNCLETIADLKTGVLSCFIQTQTQDLNPSHYVIGAYLNDHTLQTFRVSVQTDEGPGYQDLENFKADKEAWIRRDFLEGFLMDAKQNSETLLRSRLEWQSELQNSEKALRIQNVDLQQKMDTAKKATDVLQQKLSDQVSAAEALNKTLSEKTIVLDSEIKAKEEALQQWKQATEKRQGEVAALQRSLDSLKLLEAEYKQKMDALKRENESMIASHSQAFVELKREQESGSVKASRDLKNQEHEFEKLIEKNRLDAERRYRELTETYEKEAEKFRGDIENGRKEIERLTLLESEGKRTGEEYRRKIEVMTLELDKLGKEHQQSQKTIARLKEDVSKFSTDCERETKKRIEAEEKLKSAESEMNKRLEVLKFEREAELLKQKVAFLESQGGTKTREASEANNSLSQTLDFLKRAQSLLSPSAKKQREDEANPPHSPVGSIVFSPTITVSPTISPTMNNSNTVTTAVTVPDPAQIKLELDKIKEEFLGTRNQLLSKASDTLAMAIDPNQKKLLESLLAKEGRSQQQSKEIKWILSHPILSDYYYFFQMQFNDALLACHVIHSGMVANSDNTVWDTAADGIKAMSSHIPVAGIVVDLLATAFQALSYREKREIVNKGALFLVGAASIEKVGEELARQLTLSQFRSLKGMNSQKEDLGFFQKKWKTLVEYKNKILVNDIDSDIRELADDQCKRLLKGIFEGSIKRPGNVTVEPINVEPILKGILSPCLSPERRKAEFEKEYEEYTTRLTNPTTSSAANPLLFSSTGSAPASGKINPMETQSTTAVKNPSDAASATGSSTADDTAEALKSGAATLVAMQKQLAGMGALQKELETLKAQKGGCCTIS